MTWLMVWQRHAGPELHMQIMSGDGQAARQTSLFASQQRPDSTACGSEAISKQLGELFPGQGWKRAIIQPGSGVVG